MNTLAVLAKMLTMLDYNPQFHTLSGIKTRTHQVMETATFLNPGLGFKPHENKSK